MNDDTPKFATDADTRAADHRRQLAAASRARKASRLAAVRAKEGDMLLPCGYCGTRDSSRHTVECWESRSDRVTRAVADTLKADCQHITLYRRSAVPHPGEPRGVFEYVCESCGAIR